MKRETENSINRLTQGSLLRGILRLAGPMFAGALLSNLQSLIDLYWVGRLGSTTVAALALSGTVFMMLFPVIMGMATGTLALVSRAIGADDFTQARSVAGQSLLLALACGVAAGACGWMVAPAACRLLGAPAAVHPLAVSYLRIIFSGSFTICLLFIGNSVMQGAGNTVIPTAALALANLINLMLDPVLIFGLWGIPRMGIKGAALATVISQALAAALVLLLLFRGIAGVRVRLPQYRLDFSIWLRLLRIGTPGMGQMLSRSLMSLVLMRVVAAGGVAAVAAYGIGLRLHMMVLMPAFALGNAAATMVGQNLGAQRPERAVRAAWLGTAIGMVMLGTAALVLMTAAPVLIGFFDDSAEVLQIGTTYLRTVSPFYIFAAMAIVLGRALMGAGDTLSSMILTIVPLWGLQVPLALLLSRYTAAPTTGVWYAIAAAMTVHGLLVAGWFSAGRWKDKRV